MSQTNGSVPPLSLALGSAPVLTLAACAAAVWLLPPFWSEKLAQAALVWAGAILAFLAGVRRGLSFRTAHGPTPAQLLTMLWLFVLAVAALLLPWHLVAIVSLLIGYASVFVLDPVAAGHDEVPRFFARLRPPQMLVAIVSLLVLGAFYVWRS